MMYTIQQLNRHSSNNSNDLGFYSFVICRGGHYFETKGNNGWRINNTGEYHTNFKLRLYK